MYTYIIHTYVYTYIHTYIHTHIHTYTHTYAHAHNICTLADRKAQARAHSRAQVPSRARSNCRVAIRVLTLKSSTPHTLLIRDKEEEEDAYLVPTLQAEVQDGIIVIIAVSRGIKNCVPVHDAKQKKSRTRKQLGSPHPAREPQPLLRRNKKINNQCKPLSGG
jgi:hypothetical protein